MVTPLTVAFAMLLFCPGLRAGPSGEEVTDADGTTTLPTNDDCTSTGGADSSTGRRPTWPILLTHFTIAW